MAPLGTSFGADEIDWDEREVLWTAEVRVREVASETGEGEKRKNN